MVKQVVVIGLVLSVLLIDVSCASKTQSQVVIVGDSLSALGAPVITQELEAAGWSVSIDATAGLTVGDQLATLEQAALGSSDAIVVQLGTNAVLQQAAGKLSAEASSQAVDKALELLGSHCVVWVNVDADPTRPGKGTGLDFNAKLAQEAELRSNLYLVDLDGLIDSDPSLMGGDQVHLEVVGSIALGRKIAEQINHCRVRSAPR